MGYEKYISEINGKFSIDRIFNDKQYNFGVFDNYDDALEKLEYLDDEGWPISIEEIEKDSLIDEFGLSLNNIEKIDEKYIVFKYIDNEKIIFGEFDTVKDAERIRDNLIANAWESTEVNDRSKYAKYITKSGKKFVVNRIHDGIQHNFGYFDTFDEALAHREELIANNWGELNIPLKMKYGKYISFNGVMFSIQKMLEGKLHNYGFFYELDDAIKQRDWLVENNWSRLEVPDDSNKHIHKQNGKYLIYRRFEGDLEYYGTYSSLDEAKAMRNELIENEWVLEDSEGIEKISDFIYFDGEFYFIEKEIEGQKRIYGVYKNKNQAISDENDLINNYWDGYYAVPTEEYPYGENIVPFDYIFILEKNEGGIKEEIGRYYSFKEVVAARNEQFGEEYKTNKLTFSVKVGKSYKNRGWSIIRDSTYDLIPKLPYEEDCEIIVDGISTTGKLNLLPRIFYNKTEGIVEHLENLAKKNPESRINVELLLNKENEVLSNNEHNFSYNEVFNLKNKNFELKNDINELREILEYMDEENKSYLEKFARISNLIQNFEDMDISVDELTTISNSKLRLKIFDIKDLIKELKKEMVR